MRKICLGAAVALLLAALPAFAQSPAPAFKVEPGFSVAPNPQATRTPLCDCGDECKCSPVCKCGLSEKAVAAVAADPLWFALKVEADNGVGSGTPIVCEGGKTLVLTNAHVARQDRTTFTVYAGSKAYKAKRVDGSTVRNIAPSLIDIDGVDLAVVEVNAELGAVTVASHAPAIGDAVFEWGFGIVQPDGTPARRSGTVVSNPFSTPTLTSTINCVSGDSGSGVFNTNGELVGVSHGAGAGYAHHAVPLSEVRRFLGRPLLSKLFPRLSDRLAARADVRDAAAAAAAAAAAQPTPVAGPTAPAPKAAAPAAPVSGKMYRVGNGPWIGEEEFLRQFPGGLSAGSGCANGNCPAAQPPARRR